MEKNTAFRHYLQDELLKRTKKNPSFSLRAFAYQLQIEPSSLSQILNGRRNLTDKMVERLAQRLELKPKYLKKLSSTDEFQNNPYLQFGRLDLEQFEVISDWYHFAILELTSLTHFKPSVKWVASVLGISYVEANEAVKRLQSLGYLEITEDGRWLDTLGDALNKGNEYTNQAFRNFQKDVLLKAIEALEMIPYDKRVQSSLTLPVKLSKLPEAKKKILALMEELSDFLQEDEPNDEIYHMNFSLYPITKTKLKHPGDL